MASKFVPPYDYSRCTFKTLVPGPLPPGVARMLKRALNSFAPDLIAMKERWNERLPSGKLENEVFPHQPGVDICCADTAAWVLYQTGVVDHASKSSYFGNDNAFHWAPYWEPNEKSKAYVRLIKKSSDWRDFLNDDLTPKGDWLPGDYMLYSGGTVGDHPPEQAHHINVYIGPFVEMDGDQPVEKQTYYLINGSIGTTGANSAVLPRDLSSWKNYYSKSGQVIWHCRVIAVEKLFQQAVDLPVLLAEAPKPPPLKKGEKPPAPDPKAPPLDRPIEMGWWLTRQADAPYPIGKNLTWHEGLHFVAGAGIQPGSEDVYAFGPGEIALARFSKTAGPHGDASFVLLRHRFDPVRRTFRMPKGSTTPDGKTDDADLPYVYSLSMHLTGLDAYTSPDPADPSAPPALDPAKNPPPWLGRFMPVAVPAAREYVPTNAPLTVLAFTCDPDTGETRQVSLGEAVQWGPGREWETKDLPSVDADGQSYFVLKQNKKFSNQEAWHVPLPSVTAPPGKTLLLYNPRTGAAIDTGHAVDSGEVLRRLLDQNKLDVVLEADAAGNALVRLDAHHEPGVLLSKLKPAQYDVSEDNVLTLHDEVTKFSLCLDTRTSGSTRALNARSALDVTRDMAHGAALAFNVLSRSPAGKSPDQAWLDLAACVALTPDERAKLETRLANQAAWVSDAESRLSDGLSCLVGVLLDDSNEWAAERGLLHPTKTKLNAKDDKQKLLRLFREIVTKGDSRKFTTNVEAPAGDIPPDDFRAKLQIQLKAMDGMSVLPAEIFTASNGCKHALVEIQFAVAKDKVANNDDLRKQIQDRNKAVGPLADKLRAGEVVNFLSAEGVTARDRYVPREVIGRMGRIAREGGQIATGFHFEVFSGQNVVHKDTAGQAGQIVEVPQSRWLVYKDGATDKLYTKDFVKGFVDKLAKFADENANHPLDLAPIQKALDEGGVVQPAEWSEFYKANERILSRLITVHPPEWKVHWHDQAGGDDSRAAHLSDDDHSGLSDSLPEFRWWDDNLTLEGISGDDVYFYHPARFVEWLRTGLDVSVLPAAGSKLDKSSLDVKVEIPGRDPVKLDYDAATDAYYFRTVVGDAAASTPATLEIGDALSASARTFRVKIVRGDTNQIRVAEPCITSAVNQANVGVNEYAVPLSQQSVGEGGALYLLADGNAKLDEVGYSATQLVYTVTYNAGIPNKVSLSVSGAGVRVTSYEVSGAKPKSGAAKGAVSNNALSLDLQPDPATGADFDGYRTYSVTLNVVSAATSADKEATVTLAVEGGDLPGSKSVARKFKSRALKAGDKGADVAKLQVYLAQIFAHDGSPCYRATSKGEYHVGDDAPVLVDGSYGASLARALWRFAYTYAHDYDFPQAVKFTDAKAAGGGTATRDELRSVDQDHLASDTNAAPECPSSDEAAGTYYDRVVGPMPQNKGKGKSKSTPAFADYPVVDDALLATVVRHFRPPFELPKLIVHLGDTPVRAPEGVKLVSDNWSGWGGRTAMLPAADEIPFTVQCMNGDRKLDTAVAVSLEVPESSAYRIVLDGSPAARVDTTLKDLLAASLRLVPSGNITAADKDNTLVIRTSAGLRLMSTTFAGSRDLTKAQGGTCRDAALLQAWLAAVPDGAKPGTALLKPPGANKPVTVDGQWGNNSAKALAAFKTQYAPSAATFPDLVNALAHTAGQSASWGGGSSGGGGASGSW